MNRVQPKERSLLSQKFLNLHQVGILDDIVSAHIRNPYEEVVVRGGLDDNYIYGIVVEIYEVRF